MPHVFFTDSDFSTKDKNFRYILGFQPSFGAIILWKHKIDIFLDSRYIGKVDRVDEDKLLQRVCSEKVYNEKSFKINYLEFGDGSIGLFVELKRRLEKCKIVSLENNIAVKYIEKLKGDYKMEFTENYFAPKRVIKEEIEISKIKKAVEIIDNVFVYIKSIVKDGSIIGMTEFEVRNIIAVKILEYGGRKESFVSIVAFGKNSAIPHHSANHTKILNGVLLIDMGSIFEGYCSDFTRTFWVGKKDKNYSKFEEIYNIVKDAHNKVIENFQIGMVSRDLDKLARDVIDNSGHGVEYTHSLGHGVGLQIHEKPSLSKFSEEEIKENMVFTIEPGIYIKGEFGVRLEDIVFVEEGRLKKHSKVEL